MIQFTFEGGHMKMAGDYVKGGYQKKMTPLEGGSRVDSVISSIKDSILSGRFRPGDQLPNEFDMMEELNVGRNTLREAIKVLCAMGILNIRRGEGTFVSTEIKADNLLEFIQYSLLYETSHVDEIGEARQMVDEMVLSMAVRKRTEEDLDVIQDLMEQMEAYYEQKDAGGMAEIDLKLHHCMISMCHNPFCEKIAEGIYQMLEASIKATTSGEPLADPLKEHKAMIQCIADRREDLVKPLVEEHIKEWRKYIRTNVKQEEQRHESE